MNSRRWLVVMFLGAFLPGVSAHEIRPALLKLVETGSTSWEAVFKQPQVQGRFLNLKVRTNCIAGDPAVEVGETAIQESFGLECAEGSLNFVEIEGLSRTLVDTMVTIQRLDGEPANYLISASQPVLWLDSRIPAVPVYLLLGIEHLIFGVDHVLFVLVLLYIVHGWRNLVKVVTSFTLAHSITLALAALQIVNVSQAPVEALIALSIVFLAWESLKGDKGIISRAPWVVAFLFGLLHGLGFAGALAEIGLPRESVVPALFLFNVGIELGQLAIVASALALLTVIHRVRIPVHANVSVVPLYLAGSVASWWFIDRTWQILV